MTFTGLPGWLVWSLVALSAGLLAVLHLLRIRPQPRTVVTVMFWRQAIDAAPPRQLLQRLRALFSYVLLLLICASLLIALGRPEPAAQGGDAMHAVLIVDAGNAMRVDGPSNASRLDAARESARHWLEALSPRDRVALLSAGPIPRVQHQFTEPRAFLDRELDAIESSPLPAHDEGALRLAESMLAGKSRPRIVYVTGHAPSAEVTSRLSVPLSVVPIGAARSNTAILSCGFVPSPEDLLRGRLQVRVAYYGAEPGEVVVEAWRADGVNLMTQQNRLDNGAIRDFVSEPMLANGERVGVSARLNDADGPADRVVVALPLRRSIRVQIADDTPAPIRLALQSDPAIRLTPDAAQADVRVVTSALDATGPSLLLREGGPTTTEGSSLTLANLPITRGLDLEMDACPAGTGVLGNADVSLIRCGGSSLLNFYPPLPASSNRSAARPPNNERAFATIELSSALLSGPTGIANRPAWPVLISRCTRQLAGWSDGVVSLAPDRAADDPLWAGDHGDHERASVMPVDRISADLTRAAIATELPPGGGIWASLPEWFQMLLWIGLALLLLDAALHIRRRVP